MANTNQTEAEKKANAAAEKASADKAAAEKKAADKAAAAEKASADEVDAPKYTTARLMGGHSFKSIMVPNGKGGFEQVTRTPAIISEGALKNLAMMVKKGEFGLREGSIELGLTTAAPVEVPAKTEVG